MTLNDIIVSALAQLDRGHDAQTLDTWREKLTRFACGNNAVCLAVCNRRKRFHKRRILLALDGKRGRFVAVDHLGSVEHSAWLCF